MTDEELAEEYRNHNTNYYEWDDFCADDGEAIEEAYLTGLKAGRPKWHKRLERPKKKINALCFDIEQNKFILGFYDLEADEWLRYGGYETINIDLWTKIEIPEFIKG